MRRTAHRPRLDGREAADGEFTHVMVRLKTAELDIVDTLLAAGIANNRAEAIRWALTRIRERPACDLLAPALHPLADTLEHPHCWRSEV